MSKTKVTRPDQVRIAGKVFDINYVTKEEGMVQLGLTHWNDLKINIQESQHPYEEKDTILHECLHLCDFMAELKLTEEQITVLAHLLLGIFKDNTDFAKYITKETY